MRNKRWSRSSKDFDPKVYRLMATALFEMEKDASKKPAFAALQFFKLYLKEATSFDQGEKEALEKNVTRLEQRVAASEAATQTLLRALRKHLDTRNDNAALGVLDTAFALQKPLTQGRFDYGPDVSLSGAYTRTAELLKQRFPGLSLALLKKASQIRLPPKQQRRLVLRYEEMKRAIKTRQEASLKDLDAALKANNRKQAQASLRRLLTENTDEPSVYRRIHTLLLRDYYNNPKAAVVLLRLYRDEVKTTLRPDAQAWYRRLVGKELPSIHTLDQTVKAGQSGIKGVSAHKRARAFLEKSDIKKATATFATVPKLLQKALETPESLLTPLFQRLINEANNAQSNLQQADDTWKKIAAMADAGDLVGARKNGEALLNALKDNPAAAALYKKRLDDQKAEYTKGCERLLQHAQRFLGRGSLRDAEKHYDKAATCWKQLATAEPERATPHQERVTSSRQWQERLQKASPLLAQLRKDRDALRNTSANQQFDLLMPLLEGSPAKRTLKQEHLAWGQQRLRYMRFRQKGDQFAQKERWEQAVYEYKQAQKLFPRAHDARTFQRRILEYECNSGVTWEICKQFKRTKPR